MRNTLDLLTVAPAELNWYTWAGDGDGPAAGTLLSQESRSNAHFEARWPSTADAARTAPGRRWAAVVHAYYDEAESLAETSEQVEAFEAAADSLLSAHGAYLNTFADGDGRSFSEAVVVELGIEVPDDVFDALAAALTAQPHD